MRSLAPITRTQWIIIIGLELAVATLCLAAIPWLALSSGITPSPTAELAADLSIAETPVITPKPTIAFTPTDRPTLIPPTMISVLETTGTDAPTAVPTAAPNQTAARLAPIAFADLAMNPHAALASKTSFFTSACYGQDASPLQDRDYLEPADWSNSPGRQCIFGYGVDPTNGLPSGRYWMSGSPREQPHFYLIPPQAFANDSQSIKVLSHLQLIVDPDWGCDSLGLIGITADGVNFQSPACGFLKPGSTNPSSDGSTILVMPTNANNILDPSRNGGAFGFQAFPLVIFRKDFSLYFTGRDGYAPPRIWFESDVDTLFPNVTVKTTSEMSSQEVKDIASEFDHALSDAAAKNQMAALEREAQPTSPSPVRVNPRQAGAISFAATPGTVLSSISWRITPQNNVGKTQFLETNLCLDIDGEEYCFTGVEDFAHCAFFATCITGYSRLDPIDRGGYVATRYFPAGTAPVLRDGRVTARFRAPDSGVVLEVEVKVKVRNADPNLIGR